MTAQTTISSVIGATISDATGKMNTATTADQGAAAT